MTLFFFIRIPFLYLILLVYYLTRSKHKENVSTNQEFIDQVKTQSDGCLPIYDTIQLDVTIDIQREVKRETKSIIDKLLLGNFLKPIPEKKNPHSYLYIYTHKKKIASTIKTS